MTSERTRPPNGPVTSHRRAPASAPAPPGPWPGRGPGEPDSRRDGHEGDRREQTLNHSHEGCTPPTVGSSQSGQNIPHRLRLVAAAPAGVARKEKGQEI